MVKNTTRKTKNLQLFQRVYSPVYHLLEATRNVGKSVFSRSGKIVDNVLALGNESGSAVARGLNRSVNGLVRGKTRKNRNRRANTRKEKQRQRQKQRN